MPTWHDADPPPVRTCGVQDSEVTGALLPGGSSVTICDAPPTDALRVAVVFELTAVDLAVKIALVAPGATVIEGGTVRLLLVEPSVILELPLDGAPSVRVQVVLPGVSNVDGAQTSETCPGGTMVSSMFAVTPAPVAEIVATSIDEEEATLISKLVVDKPAGIVMVRGRVTFALLLSSATVKSVATARFVVTVQSVEVPAATLGGTHCTLCGQYFELT
jgi:hypothetical protein